MLSLCLPQRCGSIHAGFTSCRELSVDAPGFVALAFLTVVMERTALSYVWSVNYTQTPQMYCHPVNVRNQNNFFHTRPHRGYDPMSSCKAPLWGFFTLDTFWVLHGRDYARQCLLVCYSVYWYRYTDVSEEHSASVFKIDSCATFFGYQATRHIPKKYWTLSSLSYYQRGKDWSKLIKLIQRHHIVKYGATHRISLKRSLFWFVFRRYSDRISAWIPIILTEVSHARVDKYRAPWRLNFQI
jgi:hypothetical protein